MRQVHEKVPSRFPPRSGSLNFSTGFPDGPLGGSQETQIEGALAIAAYLRSKGTEIGTEGDRPFLREFGTYGWLHCGRGASTHDYGKIQGAAKGNRAVKQHVWGNTGCFNVSPIASTPGHIDNVRAHYARLLAGLPITRKMPGPDTWHISDRGGGKRRVQHDSGHGRGRPLPRRLDRPDQRLLPHRHPGALPHRTAIPFKNLPHGPQEIELGEITLKAGVNAISFDSGAIYAQWSDGTEAIWETPSLGKGFKVTNGEVTYADDYDRMWPDTWSGQKKIYFFSWDGTRRTWKLPPDWRSLKNVTLYPLTPDGRGQGQIIVLKDGGISPELLPQVPYILVE